MSFKAPVPVCNVWWDILLALLVLYQWSWPATPLVFFSPGRPNGRLIVVSLHDGMIAHAGASSTFTQERSWCPHLHFLLYCWLFIWNCSLSSLERPGNISYVQPRFTDFEFQYNLCLKHTPQTYHPSVLWLCFLFIVFLCTVCLECLITAFKIQFRSLWIWEKEYGISYNISCVFCWITTLHLKVTAHTCITD